MSLSRRRFLAVTAAAVAIPKGAQATTWRGTALGAEVSLTIRAPRALAETALTRTRTILSEVEDLFSLYRETSALVRLNASGALRRPDLRFMDLMASADTAHRLSGGRFDPTVQPLWQALARGAPTEAASAAVGWDRVAFDARAVRLAKGQALTFNGIAQGFATDLVADALRDLGLRDVLVNIGEYRALGGPWRIGIADPGQGLMGYQTLEGTAVATSSPGALSLGPGGHILHPAHRPLWSSVSVTARSATLADSLSTALCLAPRALVERVAAHPEIAAIRLVDPAGDLTTITA